MYARELGPEVDVERLTGGAARSLAPRELARLFAVLAHPDRIRICEELRDAERDVNSLQAVLGVTHARVSQQLALLRTARVVGERRQGRHVFYRLIQPELARWIARGLDFVEAELADSQAIRGAVAEARNLWLPSEAAAGARGK